MSLIEIKWDTPLLSKMRINFEVGKFTGERE